MIEVRSKSDAFQSWKDWPALQKRGFRARPSVGWWIHTLRNVLERKWAGRPATVSEKPIEFAKNMTKKASPGDWPKLHYTGMILHYLAM